MSNKPVSIIGSGQQASLVEEAIHILGLKTGTQISKENEDKYLKDKDFCNDHNFIIAIGDNQTRKKLADHHSSLNFLNVIHPESFVSPSAKLGAGNFIGPKAVIHTNAFVGNHCIINTSSVVEHDCIIENYVHIAPSATLTGSVKVQEFSLIGAGAVVAPGMDVPQNSIVKAGSVFKGSQ